MKTWRAVVIVGIFLASCQPQKNAQPEASGDKSFASQIFQAAPKAVNVTTPTPANSAQFFEAFEVVWGSVAPKKVEIPGTPEDPGGGHALYLNPAAFIDIGQGVVALVTDAEGSQRNSSQDEPLDTYDCHACYGTMFIDYLRLTPNGYKHAGHWEIKEGGAAYGKTSPWKVRAGFDTSPVMIITQSDGGQGCSSDMQTLVALTPVGPSNLGRFTVSSSYREDDSVVSKKDYHYEGTIRPTKIGKEITIDYHGTKDVRRVFLKSEDGRYYPVEGDEFPPSC